MRGATDDEIDYEIEALMSQRSTSEQVVRTNVDYSLGTSIRNRELNRQSSQVDETECNLLFIFFCL